MAKREIEDLVIHMEFWYGGRKFFWVTEHAASSDGIPVLVDEDCGPIEKYDPIEDADGGLIVGYQVIDALAEKLQTILKQVA